MGVCINMSHTHIDPSGLYDLMMHHSNLWRNTCWEPSRECELWSAGKCIYVYCCCFSTKAVRQLWSAMLLPVLVFSFYLGLLELTAFCTWSNYTLVYFRSGETVFGALWDRFRTFISKFIHVAFRFQGPQVHFGLDFGCGNLDEVAVRKRLNNHIREGNYCSVLKLLEKWSDVSCILFAISWPWTIKAVCSYLWK